MCLKFNFCPKCGSDKIEFDNSKKFSCKKCNWVFYFNPAAACAVIIENTDNDSILVLKRNQDPKKGFYDLPGGFVDPNESAEMAIEREVLEEIGVSISNLKYCNSFANKYFYKNIYYSTCDLIFTATLNSSEFIIDREEVIKVIWVKKDEILFNLDKFAFVSIQNALNSFLKK